MKLAEALLLRSDINKKILSLKERLNRNSVVQQGDKPHEDPEELFLEACGTAKALRDLVVKIENANNCKELKDGRTIAQALAERNCIIQQHAFVNALLEGAKKEPDRYSAKEIKWESTISVKSYLKKLEDYSKAIRELNVLIQESNWQNEIN